MFSVVPGQEIRPERPPIAANLRRLKAESGLSWEEIAREIDASERLVRKWSRPDDSDPKWPYIVKLAELFGVEPHEMYAEPAENGDGAEA